MDHIFKFQCGRCARITFEHIYMCELGHLICDSCKTINPEFKCCVEGCDANLPLVREIELERKVASLNITSEDEGELAILGDCCNSILRTSRVASGSSIKKRVMKRDGKYFILNYDTEAINASQNRWMIRFWVTAILPQEEAQKFEISLKFVNRSRIPERSTSTSIVEWKLRAHSIHQPFWKIQNHNDVGEISSDSLANCSARFVLEGNPLGSNTVGVWAYSWSLECRITNRERAAGTTTIAAATSSASGLPVELEQAAFSNLSPAQAERIAIIKARQAGAAQQ